MLNRRTFVTSTVAAAVVGPAIAMPSRSDRPPLEPWAPGYFEDRLGQRFRLSGPGKGVATLLAVDRCAEDPNTETFHVRFEVECDAAEEGIYWLHRPIAGSRPLFLQPRGSGDERHIMEATVNRLKA